MHFRTLFLLGTSGSERGGDINRIEILSISLRRLIERLSYVVETLREDASGGSDAKLSFPAWTDGT